MTRALIELLFMVFIAIVGRAILTSLFRGVSNATSAAAHPPQQPQEPPARPGNTLHKDPICGTFVPESSRFQRHVTGQTFYYCSEECRGKHALVSR